MKGGRLMKKPKPEWVAEVKRKLEIMGIGYDELATMLGYSEKTIRTYFNNADACTAQAKEKICSYLNIVTRE
jgi:predicted transcriptional regulator